MGTIDTLLRIKADSSAAVRGLAPLQASLEATASDAKTTEKALNELDGQHTISVNDQAIDNARKEVERLRSLMRDDLSIDPTADTRDAQKRIRELQRSIKTLDEEDAQVDIGVNVDTVGLSAVHGVVQEITSGLVQGGGGGLVGGLDAARGGMVALLKAGGRATPIIGGVAVGLGLAATAAWDLGKAAADVQTEVSTLNALTGGMGAETFEELNKWAAETPFEMADATDATKRLASAGVELKAIPDYLNDIGNVASASGKPVGDLAYVFAQMESSGKTSYENLQQLADTGVPVWQTLSEATGLAVEDLQKMASEGKLGADAIDLLRESLAGLYPTAMQDQSETFNGQVSTLKDTMSQMAADLGTLFLPAMEDAVWALQQLVNWGKSATGWIADLNEGFKDLTGNDIVGFFTNLIPGVAPLKKLKEQQEDAAAATSDHSREAEKLAEEFRHEQAAAENLETYIQRLVDYQEGLADAVQDTSDRFDKLNENFATFKGLAIESKGTIYEVEGAFDDLAKSLGEGSSFAPSRETGRKNWDNLVAIAESASERVETVWRTQGEDAAIAMQKTFRQRIATMLINAGVPAAEAWKRVDEVMDKPHEVRLTIGKIDTAGLEKQLARLQQKKNDFLTDDAGNSRSIALPDFDATAREWDQQMKARKPLTAIEAKINTTLEGLDEDKGKLNELANPGGDPRDARLHAKVDPHSASQVKSELDALAADRWTKYFVQYVPVAPPGLPTLPGTGGGLPTPRSAVPSALVGAGPALMSTTPTAATQGAWTPSAVRVGGGGASMRGGVERLAPKQTPVAVYLDGVEIAHRIEARRAAASTTSVRRSA